jgi:hypothetical protein
MRRVAAQEPSAAVRGLAARREGTKTCWSLLSRGDRVHGYVIRPAHAGPHPVILLAGPDGCASSALAESAASACSATAALISFDLPLCGARKSDKLSALALDARTPLAARLRPELEQQVAADLASVLALVAADPELDASRVTFVGVGLGAELARGFLADPNGVAHVAIAKDPAPSPSWFREVAERASRG